MEADFFFFAEASPQGHWNRRIPLVRSGKFRRVDLRSFRLPGNQMFMPGLAWTLTRHRYDAVVKCMNGRLMVPFVVLLARLRGLPLVLWTGMWYHPTTRFHRYTKFLTEMIYAQADAIVVYGDHVRSALIDDAGVPAEKIFVAGQAVEPEIFEAVQERSGSDERPVVLYIGQLKDSKGLDDLLAAFASISTPDARLRLAGNGVLEDRLRAQAAGDSRVEFAGYVAQEDLPELLTWARCLVLPSVTTDTEREPWGLVVNEAMHAGVPVVATDAVGAAAGGLVEHERNGFVVREGDRPALATAIKRLVDDRDLARRMGQAASVDVARFTHAAMADAFGAAVDYAIACRG